VIAFPVCCIARRFCPSVFFYLLSVVPAIWLLELNEMERRIRDSILRRNKTLAVTADSNVVVVVVVVVVVLVVLSCIFV